jgi:glycosyltransferase involved in cell wall biosynthesis
MRAAVLIPTYNTGRILHGTVAGVLAQGVEVLVVVDGSTDGSREFLRPLEAAGTGQLTVLELARNSGKGATILHGLRHLIGNGFTHVLTVDADGQHPAAEIPRFFAISRAHPEAAVFGRPVFDASAPALRVKGRKLSNFWVHLETVGWGIGDSLFGMRLYPTAELRAVFESTSHARRFDFEPEVAVRLAWRGVPVINLPTPVRYLSAEEGGVSQFRYLRDNALLTWMHLRLVSGFLVRLPWLLGRGTNPLLHLSPPQP